MTKILRVTALQMEQEHATYIMLDKITSIGSVHMVKPAPDATEENPATITENVTVINVAGQPPIFAKESPRKLMNRIAALETQE